MELKDILVNICKVHLLMKLEVFLYHIMKVTIYLYSIQALFHIKIIHTFFRCSRHLQLVSVQLQLHINVSQSYVIGIFSLSFFFFFKLNRFFYNPLFFIATIFNTGTFSVIFYKLVYADIIQIGEKNIQYWVR